MDCFCRRIAVVATVIFVFLGRMEAEEDTNRFGFTGPEIFPIDQFVSQLHVADVDGDGLNDILVVNNSRSKINLLINQTGKTNRTAGAKSIKRELNELPPDSRFRIESIASEKRIASLVLEDLNSDGRPDIAYYGEPKELVVLYNEGTNNWSSPKRWPIDDGQLSPNALAAGDLNGDGRTDLILLGENQLYLLTQESDHSLAEPVRIPFSGAVKSVQLVDIDGDGRRDLLLVNWEDRNPFRFRLQKADGQLGPETYFSYPPIRSYWADSLEQNKKTQVITIAMNSGRAQISEFTRKAGETLAEGFSQGQFQVFPLPRTDKARRGLLWADVNGDGLQDLLVAHPENGQLAIAFQGKDGTLGSPKVFPTLAGVSDLAVADWEGDGKPEIFMLSADEQQVGVTRLDDKQSVPFPSLLPLTGKPLLMSVGRLKSGGDLLLAVIVDVDGKRSLVLRDAHGTTTTQKLAESFQFKPATMAFHDVDQDGLNDLVILTPYAKVKILRQRENKEFEEIDVAPPGGDIEAQPWLSTADIDADGKPELLLTQKNFVRAVVMAEESGLRSTTNRAGWGFKVKEQINGAVANSRLAGAATIPAGTNHSALLFLLDVERKALSVCQRDKAGVWQIIRNLSLPVSEFTSLQAIGLGSGTPNAVAMLGLNSVACLPLSGEVWQLTELDGYETPIREGRLTDVVSGDLDNDGRKDLVFLETARNYLDLVLFDSNHKLVPANRWQVFEERTYRGRTSNLPEPREAAVADVTGDKKNDLVVIVHDRVLVYPQD